MKDIARLPSSALAELFENTAMRKSLTPAVVEKDFWVCFLLDHLFNKSEWQNSLSFKGGTSLSKVFGLINRFSEDIDIILDWRLLGYGVHEPWENRSNTQQDKFNERANERTSVFLREQFMPRLRKELDEILNCDVQIQIAADDPQTVLFLYPHIFSNLSVMQVIRIEIGALAAWTPAEHRTVTSFCAEEYPRIFRSPSAQVRTVTAERTFWEKVTILHREANRKNGEFPKHYSRHYYDLFCMCGTDVKNIALNNTDLLETVVRFKEKFYRCPWAEYDKAVRGTMKLIPKASYLSALSDDYRQMRSMLFEPVPAFDDIMQCIKTLEDEINDIG